MSGGSYNYLYSHVNGLEQQRGDIEEMAARLEKGGYGAPARATREVLRTLDAAERQAEALKDVWQAAEWVDSCDWSEDDLREAAAKFVATLPAGSHDVKLTSTNGISHVLTVDGMEIQNFTEGMDLSVCSGKLPVLTLRLVIPRGTEEFGTRARVSLGEQCSEALKALGWTPPEVPA